jgi:hypothetical protein
MLSIKKSYTLKAKKKYFDYLDSNEIFFIELATMIEQLGYSKNSVIWRRSWSERKKNFKLLSSNSELIVLIGKFSKKKRVLDCFIQHSDCASYSTTQSQTKTTVLEEDSDYTLSDVLLSDCESDDGSKKKRKRKGHNVSVKEW